MTHKEVYVTGNVCIYLCKMYVVVGFEKMSCTF